MTKFQKLIDLIEESFEDDIRMISSGGATLHAKEEVDGWIISLIRNEEGPPHGPFPSEPFYQIALNHKDFGFVSDQFNKDVPVNKTAISGFKDIGHVITRWLQEYGSEHEIWIGAMNPRKLRIYKRLISRFSKVIKSGDIEQGVGFRIWI